MMDIFIWDELFLTEITNKLLTKSIGKNCVFNEKSIKFISLRQYLFNIL
jgi:hypothetical protein